jgi:8-oxo-dGTP pyrophosphatase MutT (NUDIX family)
MANEAIPAATLILVRERAKAPPELLMVTRSRAMAFAPGALVFPGGRIDPADVATAALLGLQDGAAAVAAIRETIEECAVPVGIDPVPNPVQALGLQQALVSGADFGALLASQGLRLSTAGLKLFARWVPGQEVSPRFDTLFFIARAASEVRSEPNPGSGECESAQWLSAEDALEQERRGAVRLIYPTRKNLERLAQFDSFAAILADSENHPVLPITASVERDGNIDVVRIPTGLGYPVTSDPLHDVWRG